MDEKQITSWNFTSFIKKTSKKDKRVQEYWPLLICLIRIWGYPLKCNKQIIQRKGINAQARTFDLQRREQKVRKVVIQDLVKA